MLKPLCLYLANCSCLGVAKDGLSKHFFHKTSKAYPTGTRKRRKIQSERGQRSSEDAGEAHWHKTGRTHAVIVGGRQKGCKKILVLHNIKQGMREKTNWIMHQYHLGMSDADDEKDGELVLSKVFYRCPDATMVEVEHNNEKVEVTSEATSNILRVSGAAAVTAATVNMVQQQQHRPQRQAHGQDQCKFAPPNMFQEVILLVVALILDQEFLLSLYTILNKISNILVCLRCF